VKLASLSAQRLEVGGVDREQAAEHHRHRRPEAGQRRGHRLAVVRDGVADPRVGHLFDRRGEEADLARAERVGLLHFRGEHADAVDLVGGVGAHHADAVALGEHAVDEAHQNDDAEVGIVPAVDQQGLERRRAIALGRRQARDDRFQHGGHVEAGLGGNLDGVRGVEADHVLDLLFDLGGLGGRQIDLVEHRHDLVAVVDCLVDVGERLRLNALARVDHEQRALAGGKRAVDLVGEVDMAGRVDQVEHVIPAVARPVIEPHGLRLDGDAALALDVHGIEHLLDHLAVGKPAGQLDQPVGQGRFAVVDMRDDREIADVVDGGRRHGARLSTRCRRAASEPRLSSCGARAMPSTVRLLRRL